MIDLIDFERTVLPEVLHCPSVTITHYVRQAIIDFCEQTWIFSKSFNVEVATSDIVTDINDYIDIDVGEYVTDKILIAIDEFRINGIEWELKHVNLENESNYPLYLRETSEKMYSFPDNSTVRIHEMTAGEELFLRVIYKPTYEINEIDDVIYNDWVDTIASGAKAKIMAIPGQAWSNPEMVLYHERIFKRGVSEARRKIQKQFTSKPQHVKWRTFGE